MRGWTSAWILCPSGPKLVKGRSKCGDCSLATTARTPSFSQNRCPRPRSMLAAEVSQEFLRQQEWCSTSHHMHTQYSVDPSNSNREYVQGLGFQIFSLPRRKVMAFSSWTLCVLRPDLRVSILSHFSRVFCPIRKREHPVSITRFPM